MRVTAGLAGLEQTVEQVCRSVSPRVNRPVTIRSIHYSSTYAGADQLLGQLPTAQRLPRQVSLAIYGANPAGTRVIILAKAVFTCAQLHEQPLQSHLTSVIGA